MQRNRNFVAFELALATAIVHAVKVASELIQSLQVRSMEPLLKPISREFDFRLDVENRTIVSAKSC